MRATACKNNLLNCWKYAHADTPQREDETGLSVMAQKAVGSINQQRSPEQGNVQRLARRGVRRKPKRQALGNEMKI